MADYLADLEEEESTMEDVWTIRDHPRLDIWEGNDEIMDDEVERGSHSRLSPLARLSPLEEDHHGGNYAFQDDYSISTGGNGRSHEYTSDEMMSSYSGPLPDPIRLKGVGGTTLFGLNNRFDDDFPSYLVGKVAPEEFHSTMNQINSTLHKSIPFNLRCLICGCLCCCCTLGISLGPVLYLNKRTQSRLEKVIEQENWRLYNRLGLNIKLHKEQYDNTNLKEYVLHFEFVPKQQLYYPD